jgi:hypothetical protein
MTVSWLSQLALDLWHLRIGEQKQAQTVVSEVVAVLGSINAYRVVRKNVKQEEFTLAVSHGKGARRPPASQGAFTFVVPNRVNVHAFHWLSLRIDDCPLNDAETMCVW